MNPAPVEMNDPRMQTAVTDEGEDPDGVYVIPIRSIERVAAADEQARQTRPTASLPHDANG